MDADCMKNATSLAVYKHPYLLFVFDMRDGKYARHLHICTSFSANANNNNNNNTTAAFWAHGWFHINRSHHIDNTRNIFFHLSKAKINFFPAKIKTICFAFSVVGFLKWSLECDWLVEYFCYLDQKHILYIHLCEFIWHHSRMMECSALWQVFSIVFILFSFPFYFIREISSGNESDIN